MARDVRGRRGAAGLLVLAALLGLLIGAVAFVVSPLPLRPEARASGPVAGAQRSGGPGPTAAGLTSSTPSARRPSSPSSPPASASPSPVASPTTGPAFTARALLQTSEFLQYGGWGKAAQLSLQEGVVSPPLLPCLRLDQLPHAPVAAWAATYQGLHTEAAEQVVRLARTADAEAAVDRITAQVTDCDQAPRARRVTLGDRHEPDLDGVSHAVWWNVRGVDPDDPVRGVLAVVRVDDRLVALYLHATTTDPAKTTEILPLMHQAGLRLV